MNIIAWWKKVRTSRFGYLAEGVLVAAALFFGILLVVGLDSNTSVAEVNWQLIFFLSVAIGTVFAILSWLETKQSPELREYRRRNRLL